MPNPNPPAHSAVGFIVRHPLYPLPPPAPPTSTHTLFSALACAPSPQPRLEPHTHPYLPPPTPCSLLRHALILSAVLTALASLLILWLPSPRPPGAHAHNAPGAAAPSSAGGVLGFLSLPVLRQRGAQLLMAVRLLMALAFHMFAPIWQVSVKARSCRRPAWFSHPISSPGQALHLLHPRQGSASPPPSPNPKDCLLPPSSSAKHHYG